MVVQAVQEATLSALHDPDKRVRIVTVMSLGQFGGDDMIPALKVVAESKTKPARRHFGKPARMAVVLHLTAE